MIKSEDALFLTVCAAFKQERSIYGAYHLLQGKKSAQTIQDGHFFTVLRYFGLFPHLNREYVPTIITRLEEKAFLKRVQEDRVEILEKGRLMIELYHKERPYLQFLQGWAYSQKVKPFWLRLTLYIQALTNLENNTPRFYPITQNKMIQRWVKRRLPATKEERGLELENLYHECHIFLNQCLEDQAFIFVRQLSSAGHIGKTLAQISAERRKPVDEVRLMHIACLHQLIAALEYNQKEYPTLAKFSSDMMSTVALTDSARETNNYLKQGKTIEQIVKKRGLKLATIEDHLVEIALNDPSFNINTYVTPEVQTEILKAMNQLNTKRLREIKNAVSEEISYFMIRLTITRRSLREDA